MNSKKKLDYHEHEMPDPARYPDISNVASATECTGLMYRTPQSENEYESYQELSPMAIPREQRKK